MVELFSKVISNYYGGSVDNILNSFPMDHENAITTVKILKYTVMFNNWLSGDTPYIVDDKTEMVYCLNYLDIPAIFAAFFDSHNWTDLYTIKTKNEDVDRLAVYLNRMDRLKYDRMYDVHIMINDFLHSYVYNRVDFTNHVSICCNYESIKILKYILETNSDILVSDFHITMIISTNGNADLCRLAIKYLRNKYVLKFDDFISLCVNGSLDLIKIMYETGSIIDKINVEHVTSVKIGNYLKEKNLLLRLPISAYTKHTIKTCEDAGLVNFFLDFYSDTQDYQDFYASQFMSNLMLIHERYKHLVNNNREFMEYNYSQFWTIERLNFFYMHVPAFKLYATRQSMRIIFNYCYLHKYQTIACLLSICKELNMFPDISDLIEKLKKYNIYKSTLKILSKYYEI